MTALVIIAIFLIAWYCGVDTSCIFAPRTELLAIKFLNHLDITDDGVEELIESADENILGVAVRNIIMDILVLPMLLFSPYPLSGIMIIISLVHIFRNKDYKKKGQELDIATIQKWGLISNILVIAFMIFVYVTG